MRELYILGASGHGRVVYDVAKSMGRYGKICFFDDAEKKHGDSKGIYNINKYSISGNTERLIQMVNKKRKFLNIEAIVAIGDNKVRQGLQSKLEKEEIPIALLIHSSAIVSDEVEIGAGTVLMPGVVVNNGAIIGKGCILNTSCSVDHDSQIEDYCHISVGSHLAGAVNVGAGTFIGAGAVIKNNVTICNHCIIGAGAAVVKDILMSGTYVGIPAKLL